MLNYYTTPETSTENFFNVLPQNLIRMKHFEIYLTIELFQLQHPE